MKKATIIFLMLLSLSGCYAEKEKYMYWAEESDSMIKRLNDAEIEYQIKDGEIWMTEGESYKAVQCCS